MTGYDAKKLKWGTHLQPTQLQRRQFKSRYLPDALFLGMSREGNIKVVRVGRKQAEAWSPVYWKPKAEVL